MVGKLYLRIGLDLDLKSMIKKIVSVHNFIFTLKLFCKGLKPLKFRMRFEADPSYLLIKRMWIPIG
jgi:hypothetical protein